MDSIYKGDDTDSFDQNFLKVSIKNLPVTWTVCRAEVQIGNLPVIRINNPVFPLNVALTSEQTKKLCEVTPCHLAIYDNKGRKQTCDGTFLFKAKDKVVY